MITKEDYDLLDTYFKSLASVPETLTKVVSKIDKINIMNKTQDELIALMENTQGDE